ncbi:MAG: TetR family transcriptional regulator [Gammaproteobacteria bacterium]|nr:TetR family transcriptional regulator [Gammaproteobacteria bacterium]
MGNIAARVEAPRNGRTQAQRTAMSDGRMLEAAVRLIVERGTDRTTLKEVGEHAGYSRGLAGYRFGSKPGLFTFVVKSIGEEWLQELKHVTEGKAGLDAITAATEAHFRFCRDAPDHVRAFYILWFESIGPDSGVRETVAAIHRRRQRDVTAWIESGKSAGTVRAEVDAAAVAAQFCASIIGIVYQWLLRPDALDEIERMYGDLTRTMELWLDPRK